MTEAEVARLPPLVAHYLRSMGVVDRPRTWSLRAHFVGRFRRGSTDGWMPLDAWQYNSAIEVARFFRMRLTFARVVPMWGWDTYRGGAGRMRGTALGLLPVADGSGPEFDMSELVTWLNDAVLMAPGMLLGPNINWDVAGDRSFRVSITDAGRTVGAEVFLDDEGRPRDFHTHDRWADLPGGLVRAPWSTPVRGWKIVRGQPQMTGGAAVWHLSDGDFRYGEMTLLRLDRDVPPEG